MHKTVVKGSSPKGMIKAIVAQKEAVDKQKQVLGVDEGRIDETLDLAEAVLNHIVGSAEIFDAHGQVGRKINNAVCAVIGDNRVSLPTYNTGDMNGNDVSDLALALFDPDFQEALYHFQYALASLSIERQAELVDRYLEINWDKFTVENVGTFRNAVALVTAGVERHKASQLGLEHIIPLLRIRAVHRMVDLSSSYARVMQKAMASYKRTKLFVIGMGEDGKQLIAEIDQLLGDMSRAEEGRLLRGTEVIAASKFLEELLATAKMVAGDTNRTAEVQARIEAGKRLDEAKTTHSQDTYTAQEKNLAIFTRLNQVYVSNQVRMSALKGSLASLNLYVKAHQSFVLILTSLQTYLLAASAIVKDCASMALEGARPDVQAEYSRAVLDIQATSSRFANGFSRVPPAISHRPSTIPG